MESIQIQKEGFHGIRGRSLIPIGLIYEAGIYRLFCAQQTNRGAVIGHYASEDLADWRAEPPVARGERGVFFGTGGVFARAGKIFVLYDAKVRGGTEQRLAVSKNGRDFDPHPVAVLKDKVREPRVFYADGRYHMIAVSDKLNGGLCAYTSSNLMKWTLAGAAGEAGGRYPAVVGVAGGNVHIAETPEGTQITACTVDLATHAVRTYGRPYLLKGIVAPRPVTLKDGRVLLLATAKEAEDVSALLAPIELSWGADGLVLSPAKEVGLCRYSYETAEGDADCGVLLAGLSAEGELEAKFDLSEASRAVLSFGETQIQLNKKTASVVVNGNSEQIIRASECLVSVVFYNGYAHITLKNNGAFFAVPAKAAESGFALKADGTCPAALRRYDWKNRQS